MFAERRLDTFVASCGSPRNQRDVHVFSEGSKDEPDLDQDVVIMEELNHVAEEKSEHRIIDDCEKKGGICVEKSGVYIVKDHVQNDDDLSGNKDPIYEKCHIQRCEMSGMSDNLAQWTMDETGDHLKTPDEAIYQIRSSEDVSKYLGENKLNRLEINENECVQNDVICVQSNIRGVQNDAVCVQEDLIGRNSSETRLESHRPDNRKTIIIEEHKVDSSQNVEVVPLDVDDGVGAGESVARSRLSTVQHETSNHTAGSVEEVDCVMKEDHAVSCSY